MDKPLAEKGNHELLRSCFFQFRELVQQKIIPWSSFSPADSKYLNERITYNSIWNTEQASFVYNFLSKFNNDVVIHKIPLHEVTDPGIKQKHVPAKTIGSEAQTNFVGYDNQNFIIRFKYNEFWVKEVKSIQGAKWDADKRHWMIPMVKMESVKSFADKHGLSIGENAMRIMYSVGENLEQSYSAERVELNIPLKMDLFDYQTVGIDFGLRTKRVLIADDMGLGKTVQGIGVALGADKYPILVICPKSLRFNWQNEWKMWTNKKVVVADEKIMKHFNTYMETGFCDVLIVNYHGMKKYFVQEIKEDGRGKSVVLNRNSNLFKVIIIDEIHELREEKTSNFKIAKAIAKNIEYRIGLTGTPIVNKINDMASIIDILGYLDSDFGGRWKFNQRYGDIGKKHFEKKDKLKNKDSELLLTELNTKMRSLFMIRREKYQVLKDLPDKIITNHDIEITNRSEYDHAFLSLQDYLASSGANSQQISIAMRAEIMVRMGILRKIAAKGKIEYFVEFANQLFANGEKLVLFAWHKEILAMIKGHFPKMMLATGDQTDEQIRDSVYAFQNDKDAMFMGLTYKRGGTGHTLTAANHLVSLEFPWTDAILNQADARIHRISQKNTAFCHRFKGKDTIDEYILDDIIGKKRNLSKHATDTREETEEIASENLLQTIMRVAKK